MVVNKLYNCDCIELMETLPSESMDAILTDPPFLYLENQKLERPFDEDRFFKNAFRILKDDSFIAFFGRGLSFHRWNCIADSCGFRFREEIIWDKIRTTSPVLPISRKHETISIMSKGNARIRRCYIPYFEIVKDFDRLITDVKRLSVILNNPVELQNVKDYLETGKKTYYSSKITKYKTSVQDTKSSSRYQNVMAGLREGKLESSIISVSKNTFKAIHPTEKPLRLLERLINLISDEGQLIFDPFSGSGSTLVAAKQTGRMYLGCEIDKEYYEGAQNRLEQLLI